MTLRDVIHSYFRGERNIFFHPSDALIEATGGEPMLSWRLDGGAYIYMSGCDGEVCVMFTDDPKKLDRFLSLLIYG